MKRFLKSIAWDATVVLLVVTAAALMAGCGTTPRAEPVYVPVPIECKEKMPAPVVLPIDSLAASADLFVQVIALQASVEILEGNDTVLRAALGECIKPIGP